MIFTYIFQSKPKAQTLKPRHINQRKNFRIYIKKHCSVNFYSGAGTKIRWGSSIDLVIGGGLVEVQIPIPDLLGLTVSEAREQLQAKGLLLAAILTTGPVTDTANAFVIRQNPDAVHDDETPAYIRPGQTMDIWISTEPPATDSLKSEN